MATKLASALKKTVLSNNKLSAPRKAKVSDKKTSAPSKTPTLKNVDVNKLINKNISNKIAQKKAEAKENYRMSREVRPSRNDLSSTAKANRNLSNSYYSRYQKNMDDVKKLEGKYRVTNKDLSKSLGSLASMGGLKKSDVKGTYELKKAALDKKKSSLSRPTYPKNSDDYYNVNEYYRSRNKYYNDVDKINKEKDKLTKDYKKMISKKK